MWKLVVPIRVTKFSHAVTRPKHSGSQGRNELQPHSTKTETTLKYIVGTLSDIPELDMKTRGLTLPFLLLWFVEMITLYKRVNQNSTVLSGYFIDDTVWRNMFTPITPCLSNTLIF